MDSATFRSKIPWNPDRIHAVAIYCSDGRWGLAFDEFCHDCLGIPRYDRFAVPGGPAWLTLRDASLLRLYDVAREELDFLVRVHELERIVLIAHYGCAFYARLLGTHPEQFLEVQLEDLRAAAGTVRGWFAGIAVETYLARLDGTSLTFESVDTG